VNGDDDAPRFVMRLTTVTRYDVVDVFTNQIVQKHYDLSDAGRSLAVLNARHALRKTRKGKPHAISTS
jgi:hypothetical protein